MPPQQYNMEILTLIIKDNFFDQILDGTKKEEFREIRPNSQSKYCELDEEGYCKEQDGILLPRKYDAIRFLAGKYEKGRREAIVAVSSSDIELFVDENGEYIEYEHAGEVYVAAQVKYGLGKIMETRNV